MKESKQIAKHKFEQGLFVLGLPVGDEVLDKSFLYLDTLLKWNRTFNLTTLTAWDDMVVQHLLDSLSIYPYLTGKRYLDLGTGAGLPGVPLAIFMNDRHFVLTDSNSKKTAFLTHVKQVLALDNIEIVTARVEQYQPAALFDGVLSRAVGSLETLVNWGMAHLKSGGSLLAMKGVLPVEEIKTLSQRYVIDTHALSVPFLIAERHLVVIRAP